MRRRIEAEEATEIPLSLQRFRAEEWVRADEHPPPHWEDEEWIWRGIQARKRFGEARRQWRAEHGTSPEDWGQINLKGHIGHA